MSTTHFDGEEVREIELLDLFPASEGMITQYYGRIGSGKTYAATNDVLDLLRRGKVVYTNWKLKYDGYDERKSFAYAFMSVLFPWRKRFFYFPKENLRFIEVDKDFHEKFAKLTDCHVFLDEGHVAFDSYEMAKMSIEKRKAILHTRHYNRSIHIISQRPTAIHVTMRANVNVFYKCECYFRWGNIIRFRRLEFQDLLNETVDEDPEKIISIKRYWGKQKVFDAYDTKYLRDGLAPSQQVKFKAYDVPYNSRLGLLWRSIFPKDGSTEPHEGEEVIHNLSTDHLERRDLFGIFGMIESWQKRKKEKLEEKKKRPLSQVFPKI